MCLVVTEYHAIPLQRYDLEVGYEVGSLELIAKCFASKVLLWPTSLTASVSSNELTLVCVCDLMPSGKPDADIDSMRLPCSARGRSRKTLEHSLLKYLFYFSIVIEDINMQLNNKSSLGDSSETTALQSELKSTTPTHQQPSKQSQFLLVNISLPYRNLFSNFFLPFFSFLEFWTMQVPNAMRLSYFCSFFVFLVRDIWDTYAFNLVL